MLVLAIVTGLASVAFLSTGQARGDQLSDARAQAASIEAQLASTNAHIDSLDQQYDAAQSTLQQVDAQISQTHAQLSKTQLLVDHDRAQLRTEAIRTYINEGTSSPAVELFTTARNASGIESEYSDIAAGNAATIIDHLDNAEMQLQSQQGSLKQQQAQAASAQANIADATSQANVLRNQEQTTLNTANNTVATLIAQQQAEQEAEARAAAQAAAQAAAAQAAAAQAAAASARATAQPASSASQPAPAQVQAAGGSSGNGGGGGAATAGGGAGGGGSSGGGDNGAGTPPAGSGSSAAGGDGGGTVPPAGSGGGTAVQAAEAELGLPYVWGGGSDGGPTGSAVAPPGQVGQPGFDCSGLVMYAWAQAGVYLPHYTGAQLGATVQIPLSDIQPGDLLFYGPGGSDHVAMYVGGGMMIEAPETGQDVHITPIRTDSSSDASDGYEAFVGVGRP